MYKVNFFSTPLLHAKHGSLLVSIIATVYSPIHFQTIFYHCFHRAYLSSISYQLFPSSTKSSACKSFFMQLFLTCFVILSITTANKRGSRTIPWWISTFTSVIFLIVHLQFSQMFDSFCTFRND